MIGELMKMMGWLGGIMLSLCGLPQAWQSITTGTSEGISWGFLLLWLVGEIFTFSYVIYLEANEQDKKKLLPLLMNYVLNIGFILIIMAYK